MFYLSTSYDFFKRLSLYSLGIFIFTGCLDAQRIERSISTPRDALASVSPSSRLHSTPFEVSNDPFVPNDAQSSVASQSDIQFDPNGLSEVLIRELRYALEYRPNQVIDLLRMQFESGDEQCPEVIRQENEGELTLYMDNECETSEGIFFQGILSYYQVYELGEEEIDDHEWSEQSQVSHVSLYGDDFKVIYPNGMRLEFSGAREWTQEESEEINVYDSYSEGRFYSTVIQSDEDQDDEERTEDETDEEDLNKREDNPFLSGGSRNETSFQLFSSIYKEGNDQLVLSVGGSWQLGSKFDQDLSSLEKTPVLSAVSIDHLELISHPECQVGVRGQLDLRGQDGRWTHLQFDPAEWIKRDDEETEESEETEETTENERMISSSCTVCGSLQNGTQESIEFCFPTPSLLSLVESFHSY